MAPERKVKRQTQPIVMLLGAGGGVAALAYQSAFKLAQEGQAVQLVLLSARAQRPLGQPLPAHLNLVPAYQSGLKFKVAGNFVVTFVALLAYCVRHKPNAVFVWGKEVTLLYWLLMRLLCQPFNASMFCGSYTSAHLASKPAPLRYVLERLYKHILPQCRLLGVQTQAMGLDLLTHFAASEAQLVLTPPFAAERFFQAKAAPVAQRNSFVFVGRLAAEKNLSVLVQAFALLLQKLPQAQLAFYGDGPERLQLEGLVNRLNISAQVQFKGQVYDTVVAYQQAKALVMCSHYEGFPVVMVEAMASGVPVVSTRFKSGPEEIIQQGMNGLLASASTAQALADAMAEAWYQPWQPELIQASVQRFSPEALWPAYKQILLSTA